MPNLEEGYNHLLYSQKHYYSVFWLDAERRDKLIGTWDKLINKYGPSLRTQAYRAKKAKEKGDYSRDYT